MRKITIEEAETLTDLDLMVMKDVDLDVDPATEAALREEFEEWVSSLDEDVRPAFETGGIYSAFDVYSMIRINLPRYATAPDVPGP